jgi:hypothetical protein
MQQPSGIPNGEERNPDDTMNSSTIPNGVQAGKAEGPNIFMRKGSLGLNTLVGLFKPRDVVDRLPPQKTGEDNEEEGKLLVTDTRTERSYEISITNGAISAGDFRKMVTTSKWDAFLGRSIDRGLKVFDPGYRNTACAESKITYV